MNISPRAKYLIDRLRGVGERAYVVGGCVRDLLMNKVPGDWDITTSSTPDKTIQIFSDLTVIPTGLKHGTVTVIYENEPFEITTFRSDGDYSDHRRPSSVSFVANLKEDLERRDFTMNAIAFSPEEGIIDPFGGEKDIAARIIRAVGEPKQRFNEDALRIMRALRFAATLDFEIEEQTYLAAKETASTLVNIASERITEEFLKLLCSASAERVLNKGCDILSVIFPEDINIYGLSALPCDEVVRLCHVFCNGRGNFKALRLPKNVITSANKILNYEFKNVRTLIRDLGEDAWRYLVLNGADLGEYERIIENNICCTLAQLQISGKDLIACGISGKKIGEVLSQLLDEVIDDKLANEYNVLLNRAREI